jgi:hypothetical protein
MNRVTQADNRTIAKTFGEIGQCRFQRFVTALFVHGVLLSFALLLGSDVARRVYNA